MKYSILVSGYGVAYIHQSGHTKEKARDIAALLNNEYLATHCRARALVLTDERAKREMDRFNNEREYFVALEDRCVTFIEITQEMRETIDNSYDGDEEAYFSKVVCEEYDISYNNCEWSITCESCIACYGKVPQITT